MTTDEVRPFLLRNLPGFQPAGPPEVLTGGYLNKVWRVDGMPHSVIVKHAPPRVGALALDPSRLFFEAAALRALAPGGALDGVGDEHVRAPLLHTKNKQEPALVMEDVGRLPALDTWLEHADAAGANARGQHLGAFIGRLHAENAEPLRGTFTNLPIQQTRLEIQYRSIGSVLAAARVPDAQHLGARAVALGEALLGPGRCVVMGDLWPRSVLVAPGGLRVIDWEMVHVGQPFQDTAHLAAHLWMLAQRRPEKSDAVRSFASGFVSGYRAASPFPLDPTPEAAWHAGCEVLVRTLGAFHDGYLYDGLQNDHPDVQAAMKQALTWLRTEKPIALFSAVAAR